MKLAPREEESLLVHQIGFLAQKRLARGIRLNYTEAVALIACQLYELIRDGNHSVSELMLKGAMMLGINQVIEGVEKMIGEVQVEGTFPDGTKLVTVHQPITRSDGDLELALYGSFLPVPDLDVFKRKPTDAIVERGFVNRELNGIPGEITTTNEVIPINVNKKLTAISVTSLCDRPIQVGSHYHFSETNKNLRFDRGAAYGKRLNIAAGTAVRFEPGETRRVTLCDIGGNRVIHGGNGVCDGVVDYAKLHEIIEKFKALGFAHEEEKKVYLAKECTIPRQIYCHLYGPTTGDKVRLGDTCLEILVERDYTVYGDECKFGGGKVLREGMGQAAVVTSLMAVDTVITNALIVDAVTGIVKADIGIKDGMIVGIGKAGNPDIMDNVIPNLIVGVGTEVISAEGLIVTAGAIDCHVHFICPQLVREAVASGITTLYGGGTGPATGTCATTCSPGPNHIKFMIQSTDAFPLNFAFTGKGNTSNASGKCEELREQILSGAVGLKLHEDWGTTPAAIDTCLSVADEMDIQVTIHTDTLNESCCVEQTIEAFKGRTIHTYHTEGAGGGHAPDILRVCGQPNVLPSSTNPTLPFTVNTIDEHLDMLMVCHHLDKRLREDMQFAESRIRAETIAAEDILHDLGALSIVSSDSQAMGRIGEVITRTWQLADKMKKLRGKLMEDMEGDNFRVRRFIAKYTINPAIAGGMSKLIGSIEVGKLADLVLWSPAFFGAKPEIIVKGGQIAWAQMGMPNASIPTPEPVKQRKQFGAYGTAVGKHSVIFVSKASAEAGIPQKYDIRKRIETVANCRCLSKNDMILNNFLPAIKVDPQTYRVYIKSQDQNDDNWKQLKCPPSERLPLAQRYFLF